MKYNIELTRRIKTTIEAESRLEAISKSKEQNENFIPRYIRDEDYNSSTIHFCEGCDKPIFEDDEEVSAIFKDEYGNHYCIECGEYGMTEH